jgi:hypothetical protein
MLIERFCGIDLPTVTNAPPAIPEHQRKKSSAIQHRIGQHWRNGMFQAPSVT